MKLRSEEDSVAQVADAGAIIANAIATKRCINATWNKVSVVLAPHIMYRRNGDLFIDAITVARNSLLAAEERLGTFKMAGLNNVVATGREFATSDLFDREAERYVGMTLLAVD